MLKENAISMLEVLLLLLLFTSILLGAIQSQYVSLRNINQSDRILKQNSKTVSFDPHKLACTVYQTSAKHTVGCALEQSEAYILIN